MRLNPLLLPLFVAGTLGSIYFLPSSGKVAESAVRMDLPVRSGEWQLKHIPASEAEKSTLAKDTEFAKAICLIARPGEYDSEGRIIPDRVDLSVVLSGADINNSIHRPERCMPAQGHSILSSMNRDIGLGNGRTLEIKRLRSVQRIPTNEERTEFAELNCLTYYFFVGHDKITNDHYGRTFLDIKDRLLKGMDQRWAYVSASMWFGDLPWMNGAEVTEAEADRKLSGFVASFAESQVDWEQIAP